MGMIINLIIINLYLGDVRHDWLQHMLESDIANPETVGNVRYDIIHNTSWPVTKKNPPRHFETLYDPHSIIKWLYSSH